MGIFSAPSLREMGDTVPFANISACKCIANRGSLHLFATGTVARIPETKYSDAFMVRHETEVLVFPECVWRCTIEPCRDRVLRVDGDNCAGSCAVVYRGERGKGRALHQLGTPPVVTEPTGHAGISTSSSVGSAQ